jgi:hypothetical protein
LEAFVPDFLVSALCSPASSEDADLDGQFYMDVANDLTPELPYYGAKAMTLVARAHGVNIQPDVAGWTVEGRRVDPAFSHDVPPLRCVMTMTPVYRDFNFEVHAVELHAVWRQLIWEGIVDFRAPGGTVITDLDVRIEFIQAVGSRVDAHGNVRWDYGGDTGVKVLDSD